AGSLKAGLQTGLRLIENQELKYIPGFGSPDDDHVTVVERPRAPLLPFPDVLPFYQSPAGAASIYEKVSRDLTVDEKRHARNIEQRSQFDEVKVVVGCGIGAPTRIRNGSREGQGAAAETESHRVRGGCETHRRQCPRPRRHCS